MRYTCVCRRCEQTVDEKDMVNGVVGRFCKACYDKMWKNTMSFLDVGIEKKKAKEKKDGQQDTV